MLSQTYSLRYLVSMLASLGMGLVVACNSPSQHMLLISSPLPTSWRSPLTPLIQSPLPTPTPLHNILIPASTALSPLIDKAAITPSGYPMPYQPCIAVYEQSKVIPDENNPYSYRGFQHYGSVWSSASGYSFGLEMPSRQGQEFSLEGAQKGKTMVLGFEKLLCRDAQGHPYHEVLDVLVTPPMQENEILNVQDCKLNGTSDLEIITIAKYDPKNIKSGDMLVGPIKWAWRVNLQTRRFEQIPVDGIACTHWIGQH